MYIQTKEQRMHNPALTDDVHLCPLCKQPTARVETPSGYAAYGILYLRKCFGCNPALVTAFHKAEL